MAREVRSSEVKDGRSILVKEEEESPLTEDIVRQLRVLRELSEAPGPESPSLGAPGLGAPGLGACPLCEAPMRLHLLPLHHGVPHHLPCLLHYGRNYTSEEDRHQHRLSYHRLPTAHLTALAAHQPPRPTIMSPARHTGALDLGTRFQVTLHQEEGERRSDERAVLASSYGSVTFSSSVFTSSCSSWSSEQSVPDLRSSQQSSADLRSLLQRRGANKQSSASRGREMRRSVSRGEEVRRSASRGGEVRKSASRGEEMRRRSPHRGAP